ncbi:MAG: hypothetical protein K2P81_08600 [Bacteriovoracaceae bacterium]|nr:hypothetical protein [Bacteriovoracaceae bacterium]
MLKLILLLTSTFLISGYGNVDVSMCGGKPGFLESWLTNAKEIRIKCINDAYEANKQKTIAEANELDKLQKKLGEELKKVAYTFDYTMIRCSPPAGSPQNPARTKKCQELNIARNAVIDRIDKLMGWNERPLPAKREEATQSQITPPCPSKEDLQKIQVAKSFNRKLYETWERCVMLQPENFYN